MSIKRIFFIALLIIVSETIFSQTKEFNLFTNYSFSNEDYFEDICESTNGNLLAIGSYLLYENTSERCGIVFKLNSIGIVEQFLNLNDENISYCFDIIQNPKNDNLFIVGKSALSSNDIAILEITEDLEIIKNRTFTLPFSGSAELIHFLADDDQLLVYGTVNSYGKQNANNSSCIHYESQSTKKSKSIWYNPFCLSIDYQLDSILNHIQLNLSGHTCCYQMLKSTTPDNYYMLVADFPIVPNITMERSLTFLELNNHIQVIDTVAYINCNAPTYNAAAYFQDSIILAAYISHSKNAGPKNSITSTMTKYISPQTFTHFDSTYFGSIFSDTICRQVYNHAVCTNGEFCYVGINFNYWPPFSNETIASKIGIRCIDNNFNILWDKYYSIDDTQISGNAIVPLADGRLAIPGLCSKLYESIDTDFSLLIVDAEGNVAVEDSPIVASETLAYPNPTESQINIRVAIQHKNCTIELYNMNGALLKTEKANTGVTTLNISAFPSGNYIYKVYNNSGFVESGKFVKGV